MLSKYLSNSNEIDKNIKEAQKLCIQEKDDLGLGSLKLNQAVLSDFFECHNDIFNLAITLISHARLYLSENNTKKAIQMLCKALSYIKNYSNNIWEVLIRMQLCSAYIIDNDKPNFEKYKRELNEILPKVEYEEIREKVHEKMSEFENK